MSDLKMPINYGQLADTGIALHVRLGTTPLTLEEAEAFVSWLHVAIRMACEEQGERAAGIVPVVELRSGSVLATVRFMYEKGRGFVRDVARDVAKDIVKAVIIATLGMPGTIAEEPHAPPPPPTVELTRLVQVLDESGKPYVLEISEGKLKIQGNQSQSPKAP